MAMFNSYVSLPEGRLMPTKPIEGQEALIHRIGNDQTKGLPNGR